jgi:hypothetical protein
MKSLLLLFAIAEAVSVEIFEVGASRFKTDLKSA